MRYQYTGPGPIASDPESAELVRPGDVREFDEEPGWGPWEPLDEPEADEAPATPAPATAAIAADPAAPTLTAPPAKEF